MTEEERKAREVERRIKLKKLEEEQKKTDALFAKAFDKPEPSEAEIAESEKTEDTAAVTASETP